MTDYNEDPLESLLDQQSDDEFGTPEIRDKFDHGASEEKHGNLKTWSAEDFSSVYVRFYPHLVRHAKRFLTNEVQAEEVVQDAFLYLMTALPEIDSELGVLKFMKWKVRLLALDVIRATPNRRETLVDSFDDAQSTEETDSEIERADDMAVIGAALAKLNPRHREALIATVYEEKTSTEVAAQMQLSENATRQLVFRARAAFKKALVGEAEVAGKTVSEILSIAAKRASSGARENIAKVGAVFFAVGIAITGAFFDLQTPDNFSASSASSSNSPESNTSTSNSDIPESENISSTGALPTPTTETQKQQMSDVRQSAEREQDKGGAVPGTAASESQPAGAEGDFVASDSGGGGTTLLVSDSSLAEAQRTESQSVGTELGADSSTESNYLSSKPHAIGTSRNPQLATLGEYVVRIEGPRKLSAYVSIGPGDSSVQGIIIEDQSGDIAVYGFPASFGSGKTAAEGRTSLTLIAQNVTWVDGDNRVVNSTRVDELRFALTLEFDHRGKLMFATFLVD